MPIQQMFLGAGGVGDNFWIGVFGGSSQETTDNSSGIAIDSSGNVYIATISYSQYSVTNYSKRGVLFKYDKLGNLQWQRAFHVGGQPDVEEVSCDSLGNVYVCGHTGYSAGSGQGSLNYILMKYNSSGTLQWTRSVGSGYLDYCRAMAIDGSNNIYLLGQSPARTAAQVGSSWMDMCLVKYNSSGTFQTSYYHGDNGSYSSGWSVDTDSSGNYYIMGYLTGYGTTGIYVAKFNSSHSPQWRRHLNTSSNNTSGQGGIAVDSSGNSYICGDTNSGSTGPRDIYITKLNSNGTTSWQRLLGIQYRSLYGRDVTVDNSGNVYIIGKGSVDYQSASGYTSTMDTIIIAKYNNSGSIQWKRYFGVMIVPTEPGQYTDVEMGHSITVDPSGKNLYISGKTKNGNIGYGDDDCLFAKLPADGSLTGEYVTGISGNKRIMYGDASNLTDKAASLSNDSYTSGYGTLSMNAYSNDSVDGSFTGTLSQTTFIVPDSLYKPAGQQTYTSAGSYTWTCPASVTSVSVVCVGGGG